MKLQQYGKVGWVVFSWIGVIGSIFVTLSFMSDGCISKPGYGLICGLQALMIYVAYMIFYLAIPVIYWFKIRERVDRDEMYEEDPRWHAYSVPPRPLKAYKWHELMYISVNLLIAVVAFKSIISSDAFTLSSVKTWVLALGFLIYPAFTVISHTRYYFLIFHRNGTLKFRSLLLIIAFVVLGYLSLILA